MASIKISKRVTLTRDERVRLRVWISETSNNIPGKLFVYQKIPIVPLDTELDRIFVHIASYADIAEFPDDEPGEDSAFFRRHWVDLVFDSMDYMDETWERMWRMLQHTVEDISRLNGWGPVEADVILL